MKNIFKLIRPFLTEYKAELLISAGISSFIFANIWNIKATVTATHLVDEKKKELNVDKLSTKELLGTVWKCYIPSAAATAVAVPCIFLGNSVNARRNAALAAAYSVAETSLEQYKHETAKAVGEEKAKEIEKNAQTSTNVILGNNDELTLFMDEYSGRYFKSTWNNLLNSMNTLNARAINGRDIITLSEWYDEIGLDRTSESDDIGWSTVRGRDSLIDIHEDAIVKDHKAVIVLRYYTKPEHLF